MSEEVTSTEELESMVETSEADTTLAPSTLTGIVDVSNLSIKEIALVLSKSIGEFKRDTILTPLFVLIETILEILIPFRTANLVDTLRTGAELNAVIQSGAVLAAMAMLSLLFGTLSGISVAKASTGFARNLRRDMFRNIQNFSFTTIDAFSSSSLVTRLTTDISNVQMAFMMLIRMAVRAPFMFIAAFIAGFIMGGWLAIIFVAVMPLLGIGLYFIISRVIPIFKKVFKRYDALNESAEENLAGIRVVKSFVNENFERQKFDRAARRFYSSREAHGSELSIYELHYLRAVCLHSVLWLVPDYLFSRNCIWRWTAFFAYYVWLYDAYVTHDAFLCLCHDHHCRRRFSPHL